MQIRTNKISSERLVAAVFSGRKQAIQCHSSMIFPSTQSGFLPKSQRLPTDLRPGHVLLATPTASHWSELHKGGNIEATLPLVRIGQRGKGARIYKFIELWLMRLCQLEELSNGIACQHNSTNDMVSGYTSKVTHSSQRNHSPGICGA